MTWREPFVTHGGHIITDAEIEHAKTAYREWLSNLALDQSHGS